MSTGRIEDIRMPLLLTLWIRDERFCDGCIRQAWETWACTTLYKPLWGIELPASVTCILLQEHGPVVKWSMDRRDSFDGTGSFSTNSTKGCSCNISCNFKPEKNKGHWYEVAYCATSTCIFFYYLMCLITLHTMFTKSKRPNPVERFCICFSSR